MLDTFCFLSVTSFFRSSVRLTLLSGDDTWLVYTRKGYCVQVHKQSFCFVFSFFFSSSDLCKFLQLTTMYSGVHKYCFFFFFFFSSSDLSKCLHLTNMYSGVHKYGCSAKGTGGRLQLNTHATYLCGFV